MPEGPKKNSKLLIIGIVAVVIVVIIAAIAGMFLLGGVCCLGSMIFSSDTHTVTESPSSGTVTLFDESRQIPQGEFGYYEVSAGAGERLDIGVTTDGPAVDVMLMNSKQFGDYQDAVQGLNDGSWYTIDKVTYVVSKTLSYDVEQYDIYYVVIDNSQDPSDGASAGRDVTVHIVIESTL